MSSERTEGEARRASPSHVKQGRLPADKAIHRPPEDKGMPRPVPDRRRPPA